MSQASLRESISKNNQNTKSQISVRAIATGYNKRGISSDSRQDQNKYKPNNNVDALSNLITQQVEFRPNTSSPMNNLNVINPRSIVNSPRQSEHNRGSTTVSPSNRIIVQNPKQVTGNKFLPNQTRDKIGKKTLILDLDETLVHSAFKPFSQRSDILLNVELDRKIHIIHVLKRPGAEEFIERMSKHYEVVIFTASLSAYANPLMDQLDSKRFCSYRLFREHCTSLNGVFVKDMSKLGRDLKDVIIVDNNPGSFSFHKENGIPIKTWYSDKADRDLYNLTPILEALAYVNDVRDHLKKFCYNNEVNYKIANSLAATLNAQTMQLRNQAYNQNESKILSPSHSQNNYFSNSGNNFYSNGNKVNYQDKNYLHNSANKSSGINNYNNKENTYGSRISDSFNNSNRNLIGNTSSYINNVMPVNKKLGFDSPLNNNNTPVNNLNNNYSKHNSFVAESPFNRKSVLPANTFNSENNIQENTYLNNSPYYSNYNSNSGNNNNMSIPNNRSFNNYKSNLDEDKSGADVNNPNISINIINHNYSHYYINPEDEKNNLKQKEIKVDKYNTASGMRTNNNNVDKYNTNYQNKPPLNSNINPLGIQNYVNNSKETKVEKQNKYSNINLFRSGNSNMNNSFGNSNNNQNPNNNMNNNPNNNSYLNRQYPEKKSSFSKNNSNINSNSMNNQVNNDLNNFDKRLLNNSRQQFLQDKNNKTIMANNMSDNYNSNIGNLNRYNSFLSDKYSSKMANNSRPSSAVLVGQGNSNHLSRYPISSQQIQSFINNNNINNNNLNNSGAYSKGNSYSNINQQKGFISPNNNLGFNMIDRKNPQMRDYSANPTLRNFNNTNMNNSNNGYINQNYYQMNNSNNNTNLINNPQKQKFGNNLTSSVNNFDMDLSKNIGNRTTRPGTSLNDNKNLVREYSLGTPKRPINSNLNSNVNFNNNNNNNTNGFLNVNNNNYNPKIANNNIINMNNSGNYGLINRSFNGLTAKDLVYEDYNNRENLNKKNYGNNVNPNNLAISRSVERTKFKPSTPNYIGNNNYFTPNSNNQMNNMNKNNNLHQKQNSDFNYSSLIHNFNNANNDQKSMINRNVYTPTAQNYRSNPNSNYQQSPNQSNSFVMNRSNQYRNYEYYYNNNNPSTKYENKQENQNNNFSQSMRERFYPLGGNL